MENDNDTEYPAHLELLAELTETEPEEWEGADGPESGCGTDLYYILPRTGQEAWINLDQEEVTISVDGNTLFTGSPTLEE
jgi:hypothetical protein